MHKQVIENMSKLYSKYGRKVPDGTVIFMEGTEGDEMYIILEGRVLIKKDYDKYEKKDNSLLHVGVEPQDIAELGEGDFFGEMALLNEKERSASAIALEDTKLIVINKESFESILGGTKPLVLQLLKSLSNRLRNTIKFPRIDPGKTINAEDTKKDEPAKKTKKKQGKKKNVSVAKPSGMSSIKKIRLCPSCKIKVPKDADICLECGKELK